MPNFSFKPQRLPNKKRYIKISTGTILEKGCVGVVGIDLNRNWFVDYNDTKYPIHPDCWATKGVQVVYPKRLLKDGRKWVYIRCVEDGLPEIKNCLPFGAGCIVYGNVVYNELINVKFFKIKKVNSMDVNNEKSLEYARFFRKNWQLIFRNE